MTLTAQQTAQPPVTPLRDVVTVPGSFLRTPTDSARRRRIALYSHDTQASAVFRRNIALAATLVAADPETDVLLLTGAPEATGLPLPPNTDVMTLPTLCKDKEGRYAARPPRSATPATSATVEARV